MESEGSLLHSHLPSTCPYPEPWYVFRWGAVSTSPNPQAGGPLLVGCPRLLIQYIRNYPPYWRPFLHPQAEDAPCRCDSDPAPWNKTYSVGRLSIRDLCITAVETSMPCYKFLLSCSCKVRSQDWMPSPQNHKKVLPQRLCAHTHTAWLKLHTCRCVWSIGTIDRYRRAEIARLYMLTHRDNGRVSLNVQVVKARYAK